MPNDPNDKIVSRLSFDVGGIQDSLKQASDAINKFDTDLSRKPNNTWIDDLGGSLKNAITQVQTQAKQGILSLDELQNKLLSIRDTFAQAGAFTGNGGIINDKMITDAIIAAEKQRTATLQSEQTVRTRLEQDYTKFLEDEVAKRDAMDKLHYSALQQNAALDAKSQQQYAKEYTSFWQQALDSRDAMDKLHYRALQENVRLDDQAQAQSINSQIGRIKSFYDMRLMTAKDALAQIEKLMDDESAYFAANQDKELQAMKASYQIRQDMIAQQNSRGSLGGSGVRRMNGFGMMNPFDMAQMMIEFSAMNGMLSSLQEGLVAINSGAAGLQQVFEQQITSQSQLNDVTQQFVSIATTYGTSISELLDSAKQWGRQYKDINTALTLTNQATLLSVVDNVDLTTANRGLEATMNSLGLAAKTQADAYANSSRIVDSWSALAHKASVNANDLVRATEASAGAAHTAGVNFDQLQALITSAVRNTGMLGPNIGNMLKSLFASIQTDKAQNALKQLDISLKQVGANGEQQFRPVFDVLLELSQKLQTTNDSQQKLLETISGGKFQWSKVSSMLSDYNTIIDAYATSINSAGSATQYAQVQMDTLGRDVTRLRDTFAQLMSQTSENGLGSFLKTIVDSLTSLIDGFEQLPPFVGQTALAIGGLILGMSMLKSVMGAVEPLARLLVSVFPKLASNIVALTGVTEFLTVATDSEAAAFTALDIVTGGITLILGALVGTIAAVAISQGDATSAAQAHAQALQDQVGVAQQEYNLALQKQQFMSIAISQEQQLKKELDDHTLSAQQHNKVLNDMVSLYHAVGKATGDESLQQVTAANAENHSLKTERESINKYVTAKKTAYEDILKINSQQLQNDIAETNQEITDTNKKITAITKEVQARFIDMTFNEKAKWSWEQLAGFLDSISGTTDDGSGMTVSGSELAKRHQQNATNIAKSARNRELNQLGVKLGGLQSKLASDQYKLSSNKLDLLNVDTSGIGDIVSPKDVGGGSGGNNRSKPLSPAQRFSNSINDSLTSANDTLSGYQAKIDAIQPSVQMWSDAMKLADHQLSQNMNDTHAATQYDVAYRREQESLANSIKAYADENAKIPSLEAEIHRRKVDTNDAYKKGTITAKQHDAELKSLNAELANLTKTQKTNSDAIINARYNLAQLTDTWKQHNSTIMNTQFAAQQKVDTIAVSDRTKVVQTDTRVVSDWSKQLNVATSLLSKHRDSVRDADETLNAFHKDVNALTQSNRDLDAENVAMTRQIHDLHTEIATATTAYKDGRITYDDYTSKVEDAQGKIDNLTQSINQNTDAVANNNDTISNAHQTIMSQIIDDLKTTYTYEQQIQNTELKNTWDAKIDALTTERDLYQQQLDALNQQFQIQSAQNQLATDQADLAGIMADRRFQIVNPDGTLSWTYDTAKAADMQKKIADEQTKISQDAQKQALQDKIKADDAMIKQDQDTYNTQKANLDSYWQSVLSDPNLTDLADKMVAQMGLDGALKSVTTWAGKVAAQFASIQQSAISAGQATAQALGVSNPTPPSASSSTSTPSVPTSSTGGRTIETVIGPGGMGIVMRAMPFARGGMVPTNIGVSGVDTFPALLSKGEIVVPSFDDLMKSVGSPSHAMSVNIEKLEFPNVKDGADASDFLNEFVSAVRKLR